MGGRIFLLVAAILTLCEGRMFVKWNFPFTGTYADRMIYGSSPAVADLGINSAGGEPDDWLEIVVGSDEVNSPYGEAFGVWRCIDATGALEWYLLTLTDESRSSPAIADFWGGFGWGDGVPDIVGGTTSGWSVEAFSNDGHFFWRFGDITGSGNYLWHSSPAVADVNPFTPGKEIVIGNSNISCAAVFCLEGDISDGVDDGFAGYDTSIHTCWDDSVIGTDGEDWDVLWYHNTGGPIISTPALANVDDDGVIEVIIGTGWRMIWDCGASDGPDGKILCLNGVTGDEEWEIATGGPDAQVPGSPAVADVDGDGDNEIFIGAADGYLYCIDGDENHSGSIDPWEMTTVFLGGIIYSSPAVADVDGDGNYEIIVGDGGGDIDCIRYFPWDDSAAVIWRTPVSTQAIISSPAICAEGDSIPWPMFRQNPARTGFYPVAGDSEFIFIGTQEGDLVCLNGFGAEVDGIHLGGRIVTSPAVADIDKDCYLEVLIVTAGLDSLWVHGEDTLWCVATDIPSGLEDCGCDTAEVEVVCPGECHIPTSCPGQIIQFAISFDPADPLDTTRVFFTVAIFGSTVDTLRFDGTSPIVSFESPEPGTMIFTVALPESLLADGDSVVITLDSLFSLRGCKTIPAP